MAILTFNKDYSNSVELDSVLMGVPTSNEYWNVGTHPLITIQNILTYMPTTEISPAAYVAETTYSIGNLVTYSSVIYESLSNNNLGNTPDISTDDWLPTNEESQKIKIFLNQVKQNANNDLRLNRKLIENQYIYHIAKNDHTPTSDFIGWAFEHKFSDYVVIRLNKIAFQANTDQEVTFSIVNNSSVIETINVTPSNGVFSFSDIDLSFSGFGTFYLVTESQSIKSDGEINDPLKYKGMICYPVEGNGSSISAANYFRTTSGNGMGFNVSAYIDTSSYISFNEIDFVNVYKWRLAYDLVNMMLFNPNANSDRFERNHTGINKELMIMESKDNKLNTISNKYEKLIKETRGLISNSFDRVLKQKDNDFKVKHTTL